MKSIGINPNELVFIVQPYIQLTDGIKGILKYHKIELIRDPAAPLDGFYLLTKEEYYKYE